LSGRGENTHSNLFWEDLVTIEGMWDYLLAYFKEVQVAYSTAAKNNEAIITFIN
jgi:hypothetical protein